MDKDEELRLTVSLLWKFTSFMLNLNLFHIRKLYWNMSTWLERHNYARRTLCNFNAHTYYGHTPFNVQGLMNIINELKLQES